MKTTLKLIVFLTCIAITITSCKKGQEQSIDYKYSNEPDLVSCDITNKQLLKDAVYSFEADIVAQYSPSKPDLRRAYSTFMATARNKRVPYLEMTSPQTIKIFEALKNDGTLFNGDALNYNSELIDCISKNIKDQGFKTTFNALLSTNSLREDIIIPPLTAIARNMMIDKYLSTYAALEFYYKGMHNVDLTKVTGRPKVITPSPPSSGVNSTAPVKEDVDPHAGHNH